MTLALPEAVLSRIFVFFVESTINPATFPCVEPNPAQGPLLVSQISKRWRRTSFATPSLWAALYVGSKWNLPLLKLWLDRSGDEALCLQLNMAYDEDQMALYPVTTREIVKLFAAQIHRWKDVKFATGSLRESSNLRLEEVGLEKAVILENLTIYIVDPYDYLVMKNHTRLLAAIPSIPLLKSFRWTSVYCPILMNHPTWSSLTCIRLSTGLDMDQVVSFLTHCTSAFEVYLDCITNNFFDGTYTPTTLSRLRKLCITDSACDFTSVLRYFTLPLLRVLQFQSFDTCHKSSENLALFLERSGCTLQTLSIVDYDMSMDVLWILLCTPGLENIPSLSLCTRRRVEVVWILEAFRRCNGDATVSHVQDYMGGKWIGRGEVNWSDMHGQFLKQCH